MLSTQTREVAVQSQSSVKALEANTFDASATTMFLIDTTFIEHLSYGNISTAAHPCNPTEMSVIEH
jgi:hypothetical protein